MKRGLVIGRFQPFHNGHLSLVKQVLDECIEIIIVIGSAQFNYTLKNPFTIGERIEMIHSALFNEGLDLNKCYIVPFYNDDNNARWFSNLKSSCPSFDVMYSGNAFVRLLAKDHVKVKIPVMVEEEDKVLSATYIRNQIVDSGQWKSLVPRTISLFIERIDGHNRLSVISKSDTNPLLW